MNNIIKLNSLFNKRFYLTNSYDPQSTSEDDSQSRLNSSSDSGCNVSRDDLAESARMKYLDDMIEKITPTMKISNADTKNLFDIALTTFKLVKRNQEIQMRIRELQMETKSFVDSVMENPENRWIKEQLKLSMPERSKAQ